MSRLVHWRARWDGLAPRERLLIGAAGALVIGALLWLVAIAPAWRVLRAAEPAHASLDAQLLRLRALQVQAQTLQAQPRPSHDEALRLLELSVTQRLGTSARIAIAGDRVTLTLTGTPPDALAHWLAQARVNARALPGEARLLRNASGLWEGTLVLTLPAR